MDTVVDYRQAVKNILREYAEFTPSYGEFQSRLLFDEERSSYALLEFGWFEKGRVHGSIIHVDIINDKIWIQNDNTEAGIASELVEAGIPKDKIVLGFRPESVRPYTGFAVN